jgi:hypothetical protein
MSHCQSVCHCGPLSLIYENGDLRYVRLGNTMVLLRLYWAVRDRNWGTVTTLVSNVNIESKPAKFHISYDAICQNEKHGINFRVYAHQPLEPFSELQGLRVKMRGDVWAHLRFEGDIFEMEGQCNWTDASFKTFCTPYLALGGCWVASGIWLRRWANGE